MRGHEARRQVRGSSVNASVAPPYDRSAPAAYDGLEEHDSAESGRRRGALGEPHDQAISRATEGKHPPPGAQGSCSWGTRRCRCAGLGPRASELVCAGGEGGEQR